VLGHLEMFNCLYKKININVRTLAIHG
jgi:hypothetical protein